MCNSNTEIGHDVQSQIQPIQYGWLKRIYGRLWKESRVNSAVHKTLYSRKMEKWNVYVENKTVSAGVMIR